MEDEFMRRPEIYEKHPELFHYTNRQGLFGILQSQRLRATHFKYLNDISEIQVMKLELSKKLFPVFKDIIVEKFRSAGMKEKNRYRESGGVLAIAKHESRRVSETFYNVSFENENGNPGLAIPYITSFCAHTSDQKYEQENGLLSMWRAYGGDGFSIVFDTRKLTDLYKKDCSIYYYSTSFLGDVVYQDDDKFFNEEFGEIIEKITNEFRNYIGSNYWNIAPLAGDVLPMFARFKHRGFFEEREVRFGAFPMSSEIEEIYRRVDPTYVSPSLPLKKFHKRDDGTPFIEMFDFEGANPLPIKRIIVGPQHRQHDVRKEILELTGKRIEVHCSATPLSIKSAPPLHI